MQQNLYRHFYYLKGEQSTNISMLGNYIGSIEHARVLWVGDRPILNIPAIPATKAKQYLGQQFDLVVYDAIDGLHPEGIAAIAATVRGGGYFILLIPDNWGKYCDPILKKIIPEQNQPHWHLLQRFELLLGQARYQAKPCEAINVTLLKQQTIELNDKQRDVVVAVTKVATGHRHRPLIVTADRGRGKSTALAAATLKLLTVGNKIIITAPRFSAVKIIFDYILSYHPTAQTNQHTLKIEEGSVCFIPPDLLTGTMPENEILLVDEAAAIPLNMLSDMLHQYPRIVFSTTTQGYEGSGQGFNLRFKPLLTKSVPHYKTIQLTTPVRWADNDPLEKYIWDALLLNNIESMPVKQCSSDEKCEYRAIDYQQLVVNEDLLKKVFSLLVNAHYQTTPIDLLMLLDGKNVGLWIAVKNQQVIGVLQYLDEGQLDQVLASEVSQGDRRIQGHLLPQYLAMQYGDETLCQKKWRRFVRVAIDYPYRRQGIATQLIKQCELNAKKTEIDFCGASFAMTADVIKLWQKNDFQLVQVGYKKDTASGCNTAVMINAYREDAVHIKINMRNILADNLPIWSRTFLRQIPAELIRLLFIGIAHKPVLSERDKQSLEDYANGSRQQMAVASPLEKLAIIEMTQQNIQDSELLIKSFVQYQDAEYIISNKDTVDGKKSLQKTLRDSVKNILLSNA